MKKFSLLLSLFFAVILQSSAQTPFQAVYTINSQGYQVGDFNEVIETHDNYLVAVGYATNTNIAQEEIILAKFTNNGSPVWAKTYGIPSSHFRGISVAESNDPLDRGFAIAAVEDAGIRQLVLKTDALGNLVWVRANGGHEPASIMYRTNGEIAVLSTEGYFGSTYSVTHDIQVSRYTPTGTLLNHHQYGALNWHVTPEIPLNDHAIDFAELPNGGFFILGQVGTDEMILIETDANMAVVNTVGDNRIYGMLPRDVEYIPNTSNPYEWFILADVRYPAYTGPFYPWLFNRHWGTFGHTKPIFQISDLTSMAMSVNKTSSLEIGIAVNHTPTGSSFPQLIATEVLPHNLLNYEDHTPNTTTSTFHYNDITALNNGNYASAGAGTGSRYYLTVSNGNVESSCTNPAPLTPTIVSSVDKGPSVSTSSHNYSLAYSLMQNIVTLNRHDGCIQFKREQTTIEKGEQTSNLIAYPNPASTNITIQTKEEYIGGTISIYDIQGKVVIEKILASKNSTLDVRNLKAGFYLLKLNAPGMPEAKTNFSVIK